MTNDEMASQMTHVVRRVRWVTVGITLICSLIGSTVTFGFIGGLYVARIESRIEAVEAATDRSANGLDSFRDRVRVVEARQQAAETTSARLEERLVAQGRQLSRIEALLQELARAPHRQRMDPR